MGHSYRYQSHEDDDENSSKLTTWFSINMKIILVVFGVVVLLLSALIWWFVRRRRRSGQVLRPAPTNTQPAYPQQQYTQATHNPGYPPQMQAPYPQGGAPYPGAPYRAGYSPPRAPYPPPGAPHPYQYSTGGGLPNPEMPKEPGFTGVVPPPSYNDTVASEAYSQQPSFNPNFRH